MDTRRRSDGHEDRPKPELGTETVPVELIELQSVGSSGRRANPKVLGAIAVVGILAFSVIVLARQPQNPTPSPSAPIIGLASPTAASPTSGQTVAPATFRPSLTPPTPIPTAPPPWQWTRTPFVYDVAFSPEGISGVNGQMLVLVRRSLDPGDLWGMINLTAGGQPFAQASTAIEYLSGATVIDGRVWFLAKLSGVSADQSTSRLVSTADGDTWDSLGVVEGLGDHPLSLFLGRVGANWVTAIQQEDTGGEGTPAAEKLMWSSDGVRWQPASLPRMTGIVTYAGAATLGDTILVAGSDWRDYGDEDQFVLTSQDGRTWQRTMLQVGGESRMRGPVCNQVTCILIFGTFDPQGDSTEELRVFSEGTEWTEVHVSGLSADPASHIRQVIPTELGFMAMSYGKDAWLSPDGRSWRGVEVLPPGLPDDFMAFAVAGDLVVGLVDGDSGVPDGYWSGSLAAMESALQ